jgi:predicted ATPase
MTVHHHAARRVVITGGPGAGKTAILELVRTSLCRHVKILPEAAGIVFGGGFPRGTDTTTRCAAQRAIFYVQRELERTIENSEIALTLCDRGTVDGIAYWKGSEDMFQAVGSTLDEQLARYHTVIHLRTPPADAGYNYQNPLRVETATEAAAIDEKIARAWANHPRRFEVPSTPDFLTKATRALELVRAELPLCCRGAIGQ